MVFSAGRIRNMLLLLVVNLQMLLLTEAQYWIKQLCLFTPSLRIKPRVLTVGAVSQMKYLRPVAGAMLRLGEFFFCLLSQELEV